MPYKSIEELPEKIRKVLPKKAQELFLRVFNKAYEKYDEATAFKVAWAVIKKKYIKKNGKWVLKSKVEIKKVKAKSEFADEKVFVDFVLTTPDLDSDREVFHKSFLDFIGTKLSGLKGDLEHSNLFDIPEIPKDWVAKIIESKPIDGCVYATAVLNNKHPLFEEILNKIRKGELGASIEVAYDEDDYYLTEDGVRIYVDGEPIGFSFTEFPANDNAKILRLRKIKVMGG